MQSRLPGGEGQAGHDAQRVEVRGRRPGTPREEDRLVRVLDVLRHRAAALQRLSGERQIDMEAVFCRAHANPPCFPANRWQRQASSATNMSEI